MALSSHEAPHNETYKALRHETRKLIARMAWEGVDALRSYPRIDKPNMMYNSRKTSVGDQVRHFCARTTIAPWSYGVQQIIGLDRVRLMSTYTEKDVVQLRAFGRGVLRLPDLPFDRGVGVELRKNPEVELSTLSGSWRDGRRFSISTRGYAEGMPFSYTPAHELAVAGVVAQGVKQAQSLDIGVAEAQSLYDEWRQNYKPTPQPRPDQPMWSILDSAR